MKHIFLYFILLTCLLYSCSSSSKKRVVSNGILEKAPAYNKDSIDKKDANGLKQGIWVEYGKSGKPITELHYKDNCLDGTCKVFNEDGNVSCEIQYTHDTLDGEYRYYAPDGKPVLVRFYIMGILKAAKHFNSAGKLEHIDVYDKNGNITG